MSEKEVLPKKEEENKNIEESEGETEDSEEEGEKGEVKVTQNFIKPGKVVLLLQGRHAGSKAVVLQNCDVPDKKKYNHSYAYVCGISKYPGTIKKKMNKRQVKRRTRFRCFLKRVGYTHIMPTRYGLDISDFPKYPKGIGAILSDASMKRGASQAMHKVLEKKYMSGKNHWFFTKLKF